MRFPYPTVICAALACLACSPKPDASTAAAPSLPTHKPDETPPKATAAVVPEELKTDAYHYFGLGSEGQRVYSFSMSGGAAKSEITVVFKLKQVSGGKATYEETDTGGPTGLTTQTMSLEKDGLYIESISPQTLTTPHFLELPARLTPGSTWTSHQAVKSASQMIDETLVSKVVGPKTIKTPAGTFETTYVVATGKGEMNSSPMKMTVQSWFSKDSGMIRQTAEVTSKSGHSTLDQTLTKRP